MIRWRFFLTPFAALCTEHPSDDDETITFVSYYIFGIRVAWIHTDR